MEAEPDTSARPAAIVRQRTLLIRWRARAPRLALYAVAGVLALIGVRTLIAGPRPPSPPQSPDAGSLRATNPAGFAEAFVRSYLTYDPSHQDAHTLSLRPFLASDLDPDAGVVPDPNSSSRVVWTAVVAESQNAPGHTVVTVATARDGQPALTYVSVPVATRPDNLLVVDRYPSIVGSPPGATDYQPRTEEDIADPVLAGVIRRALANYLAGATDNLRADLARPIALTPPTQKLALDSVASLTWAAPKRVAAQLVARAPTGDTYTLRYELAVVKRDRWYVLGLNPPATSATNQGAKQ